MNTTDRLITLATQTAYQRLHENYADILKEIDKDAALRKVWTQSLDNVAKSWRETYGERVHAAMTTMNHDTIEREAVNSIYLALAIEAQKTLLAYSRI